MHILITGGTGTIGQRLVPFLLKEGHVVTVLSRYPTKPHNLPSAINLQLWDGITSNGWGDLLSQVQVVINLAGAGIADRRWSHQRKQIIKESRTHAGEAIVSAFDAVTEKPPLLIQASAVGYYGYADDLIMTEESPAGDGFLSEVCTVWEQSVRAVEAMGVRVVYLRTGVVFDVNSGAFPQMITPFKYMVGGPVGSGKQWISWIHWLDVCRAVSFIIQEETLQGPINLSAPHPIRNRAFATLVGKILNRPSFITTPSFMIQALLGEMSELVLKGQQVIPQKLQAHGFAFTYPKAEAAITALLTEA